MNLSTCGPDERLASRVPYCQTSSSQRVQVKDYLQQRLRLHFPTLTEPTWTTTLDLFQPDLWVGREHVTLATQDLVSLTQYLARSPELPVLDPPVYGLATLDVAQHWLRGLELAFAVLPELIPGASGPHLIALLTYLYQPYPLAEQVVQAWRWDLASSPFLPPGLPDGSLAPGTAAAARYLARLGFVVPF